MHQHWISLSIRVPYALCTILAHPLPPQTPYSLPAYCVSDTPAPGSALSPEVPSPLSVGDVGVLNGR